MDRLAIYNKLRSVGYKDNYKDFSILWECLSSGKLVTVNLLKPCILYEVGWARRLIDKLEKNDIFEKLIQPMLF
jgi:hypothetical protein